jgi:hypothetical protein
VLQERLAAARAMRIFSHEEDRLSDLVRLLELKKKREQRI